MIKNIKYNGHTANPSDYECADGDLALSVGLVPEDGALKPVLPPKVVRKLGSYESVALIHNTPSYKHYIVTGRGQIENKITISSDGHYICAYPPTSHLTVYLRYTLSNGNSMATLLRIPSGTKKNIFVISSTTDTVTFTSAMITPVQMRDTDFIYSAEIKDFDTDYYNSYTTEAPEKFPTAISYFLGEDDDPILISTLPTDVTIRKFDAIGNVLVALTSEGLHYFLWKDEGYIHLGNKIPELGISFGLQGTIYEADDSLALSGTNELSDENLQWCAAKINKFIADNATNYGKFAFPFFVRYAYRMYDGSLTMHSAPILMMCTTGMNPIFAEYITRYSGGTQSGQIQTCQLNLFGITHSLDYMASSYQLENLRAWKDVVKSVDIFISAPIYTYDQNALDEKTRDLYRVTPSVTRPGPTTYSELKTLCLSSGNHKMDENSELGYYLWHDIQEMYEATFETTPTSYRRLFERDLGDVKDDIKSCSQFYLLKSIPIDELETSRTIIDIPDDYLPSLVNREVMDDDYDSHDTLIPQQSFDYNNRLNIANIEKRYFDGYERIFSYRDSSIYNAEDVCTISLRIAIKPAGGGPDIIVGDGFSDFWFKDKAWMYIFYPNISAYKVYMSVFNSQTLTTEYYEAHLTPHDFLNGAYYFSGDSPELTAITADDFPELTPDAQAREMMPNKIYASQVDNPYHFPLLGINTLGFGAILGMCAAVKALSQGQFGQFPLYAFSASDGVWALEVDTSGENAGLYSAKQIVTRDVCINADSITQIDSSVLFATDRGIMMLTGSQAQCISMSIESMEGFGRESIPKFTELIRAYNNRALAEEKYTFLDEVELLPFLDFLKGCSMIYDYVHQRIIVFNPSVGYAYVYSLKSAMWGMTRSRITNGLNSYPEAMAMSGNELVNISFSDAERITTLAISRPFKLDDPNGFKTIDTIIQRGDFNRDHITQVLYGSNDLINWHVVWSSTDRYMRGFRGTPYKAYRIAFIGMFDKTESIYGFTAQFNPRLAGQPR